MKTLSVKLTEEMQNCLDLISEYYSKLNGGYILTKSEIIRILILNKYAQICKSKEYLDQNNGL